MYTLYYIALAGGLQSSGGGCVKPYFRFETGGPQQRNRTLVLCNTKVVFGFVCPALPVQTKVAVSLCCTNLWSQSFAPCPVGPPYGTKLSSESFGQLAFLIRRGTVAPVENSKPYFILRWLIMRIKKFKKRYGKLWIIRRSLSKKVNG